MKKQQPTKPIYGSDPFTAVRINDRQYVLKASKAGFYRIGDDVTKDCHRVAANEELVIDQEFVDQIYQRKISNKISHYVYHGMELSPKEYADKVQAYYHNCVEEVDDDSETLIFYTIEQRDRWIEFKNNTHAVFEDIVTFDLVSVIKLCQSLPETSVQFIEPMRKISGDVFDTLYSLDQARVVLDFVRTTLIKNGYTELTQDSVLKPKTFYIKDGRLEFSKLAHPLHDTTCYMTVFSPILARFDKLTRIKAESFENCVRIKNEIVETLQLEFATAFDTFTKLRDNPILLRETIEQLDEILLKMGNIRCYSDDTHKKNEIVKQIRLLSEKCKKSTTLKE